MNSATLTWAVCARIHRLVSAQLDGDADNAHDALGYAVYHPMQLLRMIVSIRDNNWEARLKTGWNIFDLLQLGSNGGSLTQSKYVTYGTDNASRSHWFELRIVDIVEVAVEAPVIRVHENLL